MGQPLPDPRIDAVSELQEQASRVGALLFNLVGALQRDAPPVSVSGEPVPEAPGPSIDFRPQCKAMVGEIMEALEALEASIRALPDLRAPPSLDDVDLGALAALHERSVEAARAASAELQAATAKLAQLQGAYGVLADLQLRR